MQAFEQIEKKYQMPVIVSTHPHTRNKMQEFGVDVKNQRIRFMEPFGFFDFVHLERNAFCVLSDSGTVQEECSILKCQMLLFAMLPKDRRRLNAEAIFCQALALRVLIAV